MVKKTSATAAPKGAKSPVAKPTPERRSTRATTAATPVPETAEKPTSSASKKRKTSDDFLDEAPKGKEESTKKARASTSKKTAAATTPSKEKDVTIAKPVVTAVTTVDALPLPTTKSAPASGKGKKAVAANKKAAAADPGLVKPSADKPAEGLKSALKKATPAPAPEKSTKKKASAPAAGKKVKAQEDDAFIHGFSSSEGEDSDDDDESDVDMDGGKGKSATVDVKTLPTIAKDDKSVQRKLTKAKKKQVRCISSPCFQIRC
jgi:nucleolar protein 15